MFMSRITVSPQALNRLGTHGGGAYGFHRLLWSLYSDSEDRRRDFVFRHEGGAEQRTLLVVSARSPVSVPAGVQVVSKEYQPALSAGETLRFAVRVNPTVRAKANGKRHDVVMHARSQAGGRDVAVEEKIVEWLRAREISVGCKFHERAIVVDGYYQERFRKKGHAVAVSVCDVQGLLTVTDSVRFTQSLYSGIGTAKAFGCGLILVRRMVTDECAA